MTTVYEQAAALWPSDCAPATSRLYHGWIVVLARSVKIPDTGRLFLRARSSMNVVEVKIPGARSVRDILVDSQLGVFALAARRSQLGGPHWDGFVVLRINPESNEVVTVQSDENWEDTGGAFVVRLLGVDPQRLRLAVACGRHEKASTVQQVEYRLAFLNPDTGQFDFEDILPGMVF
jgi:hypothetical protein